MRGDTYTVEEGIAVPVPCVVQLDSAALALGPSIAVSQGREKRECDGRDGQDGNSTRLVDNWVAPNTRQGESCGDKVIKLAESYDGKVQCREVVVQEELALHEVEGEIVKSPSKNRCTHFVVETLESGVIVVSKVALPAEDGNTLDENVGDDGSRRRIPDHRVADQVDLTVVLTPEVDTTAQDGPRLGARVPSVRLDQASVGSPHDLLELPELAKEARTDVVGLLCVGSKRRVLVILNIPETVGQSTALGAGDFLLLRGPVGQLHLVREENTACHDVDQTELGLNCSDTVLGKLANGLLLDDLDAEQIVGVTREAFVTVGRNLVLPFCFRHRRANIVGVKTSVRGNVVETDHITILDVVLGHVLDVVPSTCAVDRLAVDVKRLSLVLDKPNVVVILVGVKSDLLLLTAARVHERVGVEVSALRVDMSEAESAAECDIDRNVLHTLVVQGGLEFGTHEAISVTGVAKAQEVDSEHGHVEGRGDDDQAEYTGQKVLGKETHSHRLGVTKENPELDQGQRSNPGNGEETNPLDAEGDTQTQTCHKQPEPPSSLERLCRTLFVLVGERGESKGGEGGREDERRIEEDQASLGEEAVLEDDEGGAEGGSRSSATRSLEGQEHGRNKKNTADGREQSHGDVGNLGLEVVLANILEIEISIETGEPANEGDEHLGERGVNIHEESALDVLGGKATKAVGKGKSAI